MSSNLPARGGRPAGGSTPSAPGAAATEDQRAQRSRERSSAQHDARAAQRRERQQTTGTGTGRGLGKAIGTGIGTGIGGAKDEVSATELGSPRRPATSDDETSKHSDRGGRARHGLASRRAARRAVVLRELLGPPVALRPRGSDVPGLRS